MRQLLLPLLIAVLATLAALLIAVPPRALARFAEDAVRSFNADGPGTDGDRPTLRAPPTASGE